MTVIADYLSLAFWSTLLHLNRGFVKLVTGMTPTKLIKNRVIAIFASVGVKIVCEGDDDSDVDVGKDKQFKSKIVVKDDRFFVRVVRGATLGLGEAYMDGWFECDDIPNFLRLLALGLTPKTGRKLSNKVALARNRQGIVESQTLIDVHYKYVSIPVSE